jgi:putative endonuclease
MRHSRERGNPGLAQRERQAGMSWTEHYYVYILASKRNGTLYIGVTNDLIRRTYEHRNGMQEGFTKEYQVHNLVYYEAFGSIELAIQREKRLKKWRRAWKIRLVEESNKEWLDLYPSLVGATQDGFPPTRE